MGEDYTAVLHSRISSLEDKIRESESARERKVFEDRIAGYEAKIASLEAGRVDRGEDSKDSKEKTAEPGKVRKAPPPEKLDKEDKTDDAPPRKSLWWGER